MASNPVNPYCTCDPCHCTPPCTCGLHKTERHTEEMWDANLGALRWVVTEIFRPAALAPPRSQPPRNDGGHGHGDHSSVDGDTVAPEDALAEARDLIRRRDNVLHAYAAQPANGHQHEHSSVRTAEHKGHHIEIKTTYELTIDGDPLEAHMEVSPNGNVHYHGIPNYTSASAVDVLKQVIDSFPDDYPPLDPPEDD